MNPLITNETLPNNIMILQMEGKLSIHYQLFSIDFVNSDVTTVVGKKQTHHTKFTKPNREYTNTKPRILKK